MRKQKSNEYALHLSNLYIGGLLAAILVILQAFFALVPDIWVDISVSAFALALPPLAGVLVVNLVERKYPYGCACATSSRYMTILSTIGGIAALAGIDAAFWHMLWVAGAIFLVALVVAVCIYGWYVADLEEEPQHKPPKETGSLQREEPQHEHPVETGPLQQEEALLPPGSMKNPR